MPHISILPSLALSFLYFFPFTLSVPSPPITSLLLLFPQYLCLPFPFLPSLILFTLLRGDLLLQDLNLIYSKGEAASLTLLHL